MNFVAGLALINPEKGSDINVSVPTYLVTYNQNQEKPTDTNDKASKAIQIFRELIFRGILWGTTLGG